MSTTLTLSNANVRSLLVLYDDPNFFIGDTCIILDKLKICKQFFTQAHVTINFISHQHLEKYKVLLQNNPYIDTVLGEPIEKVDLTGYDFIICISMDEQRINRALTQYVSLQTPVYSFSKIFFPHLQQTLFPLYLALLEFANNQSDPKELYISAAEKQWANDWLRNQGLKEDEQLFIIIDTTTRKDKLLSFSAYYELLYWLLQRPKSKILIFDERNSGKELFYKELMGADKIGRFIFSKQLGLRQDICLIGAGRADLILGPCTGLMHCASAIYNQYAKSGVQQRPPVMITYTGKNQQPTRYWWNDSPLMDVLQVINNNGAKELVLLDEHTDNHPGLLTCADYTSAMLTTHISKRL